MYHTIPLVVMGMQLGTALVSLHLTMEDVTSINNAGKPYSTSQYDPTAMSQFIIDVISDIVAFVAGISNHLSLLCLFSVISVLFTATALNVVCLFSALIRLIIVSLRRYHWVVKEESAMLMNPESYVASTRPVQQFRSPYPLMKPNTMRFILSLFTNGVLLFTSLYLVIVILCLIKRKTSNISQAVVLVYNPLHGEVTWQPKKYGRLIPVFGTLLALSGCASLMGFIIGATILSEDQSKRRSQTEIQRTFNHWNGLQCGIVSLLAGILTILSIICRESKAKLLSYFSVLFSLVALLSSSLTLHSEQFLFPQLEEKLTTSSGNYPSASELDPITYRHFLLTKIALITFASVFNYIFAIPLVSLLVLHVSNQRPIHLLTCSIASQPPSYRDCSQPELIPLESSMPLMDMTESSLFSAREQARYAAAAACLNNENRCITSPFHNQLSMMGMRGNTTAGVYAIPNTGGMGFHNRIVSPDSASSSTSTRRPQFHAQKQQSPLIGTLPSPYAMTSAPSGRFFPVDSANAMVDENGMPSQRYSIALQDAMTQSQQQQQQQGVLFYNASHPMLHYNHPQQQQHHQLPLSLGYTDSYNGEMTGVRRESIEKSTLMSGGRSQPFQQQQLVDDASPMSDVPPLPDPNE